MTRRHRPPQKVDWGMWWLIVGMCVVLTVLLWIAGAV
jgi:hypothetical protein